MLINPAQKIPKLQEKSRNPIMQHVTFENRYSRVILSTVLVLKISLLLNHLNGVKVISRGYHNREVFPSLFFTAPWPMHNDRDN